MPLEDNPDYGKEATDTLTPEMEGREASTQQSSTVEEQPKATSDSDGQLSWLLPDGSDTDGDRRGFLSTRTEVHALVLGITAGAHVSLSGKTQIVNDVLGITIAGDRARQAQHFPQKYRDQAKEELPYFLVGIALGYGGARADMLAGAGGNE